MKKENTLCIISLILMFAVPPLIRLTVRGSNEIGLDMTAQFFKMIVGIGSYIWAWVLAIIARMKYNTKFSRILIIIYSVILAIALIIFVLAFLFIFSLF